MSFKSIMVHVETAPSGERRVRAAAALAATFEARLIGVGAVAMTPVLNAASAVADGELISALMERVSAELPKAEARFRELAHGCGRPLMWLAAEDFPNRVMARHARGADLLVASRTDPRDGADFVVRPVELILEAGAPVLLASDSGPGFSGESVIVAWKDGRESRRALTDSLPFLKRAKSVVIVHAPEGGPVGGAGLEEITARLALHGIKARTEILDRGKAGVAEALGAAADRHGADLIVAGAFGRSRVSEWVLGGVTQDFVRSSTKFILFSH